jgi:hypothetical protein
MPRIQGKSIKSRTIAVLQFNSMKAQEIYRRFIGRSAGNNSRMGQGMRMMRHMRNLQTPLVARLLTNS